MRSIYSVAFILYFIVTIRRSHFKHLSVAARHDDVSNLANESSSIDLPELCSPLLHSSDEDG